MAQDFTVLRCSQCKMYQVHPARKSNKWQCKVCGLKQSVIKVYGSGSSQDCRRYVQASNSRGGHLLEVLTDKEIIEKAHPPEEIAQEKPPSCEQPICSKWTVFTSSVEEINSTPPTTEDDKKCTTNADEFSRFKKKSANLSKRKLEQDEFRECSDAKRRNVQVICNPKSLNNEDNLPSQFSPDLKMPPFCATNTSVAKSQPSLCMETKPIATCSKWSKYT